MSEEVLLVERHDDVVVLTINRPQQFNALNLHVLSSVADEFKRSASARAIIITGAGDKAFSAGADVDELSGVGVHEAMDVLHAGVAVMSAIERSSVPVIAAINGLALGGGLELALACTFPLLSDNASIGLPESGLGLIPGYGGTQRLPAAVGSATAAHMMLTGSRLSAARAYQLGFSPLEPVARGDLLAHALEVATEMTKKGPRAQAAILAALQTSRPSPEMIAYEATLAAVALAGEESDEGIAAFRERRAPEFRSASTRRVHA